MPVLDTKSLWIQDPERILWSLYLASVKYMSVVFVEYNFIKY